jgi:hypothetical protein
VASFTPQSLYPRGKSPWYPLERRLGGPHSRSGSCGEETILDPTGTRTPNPWSSSPQPVAIPTGLSRLPVLEKSSLKSIVDFTIYVYWTCVSPESRLSVTSSSVVRKPAPFVYCVRSLFHWGFLPSDFYRGYLLQCCHAY